MIGYNNVIIDTHLYLNFELMNKSEKNLDDYLPFFLMDDRNTLKEERKTTL